MSYYEKLLTEAFEKYNFDVSKEPEKKTEYIAYESVQSIRDDKILERSKDYNYLLKKYKNAIIEKVVDEVEWNIFIEKKNKIVKEVLTQWIKEYEESYPQVSSLVFDLCYKMAWDDGHSWGYGEVESYIEKYLDFAQDIIQLTKGT